MAKVFKQLWFTLSKHYRIVTGGCFGIFSRKLETQVCSFALQHLYGVTETISSLWVPAHAHTAQPLLRAQHSQFPPGTSVAERRRHRRTWGRQGAGACFLMEFAHRFRLTRSDHNLHLETIFSNMSHILENRFRCLELVQNSCKKCSVQMKKISLQCLLSTFLTE